MGTVTFVSAVNASLKRVRVIAGDTQELATSTVTSTATGLTSTGAFTVSSIQNEIDIMLQCWNEAITEVYTLGMFAPEVATATVILSTAVREYTLPSDFEKFAGRDGQRAFRGATRQWVIDEYPGGFAQMLVDQAGFASDWQGEPQYYAISPVTSQTVRFDREPTSNENGWTYNALYDKRISRSSTMATDTMPFSDTVTDSLVPVVAEAWSRVFKKEFDSEIFRYALIRALEHVTQTQRRTSWGPSVGV